jgi:hypothetical protein
VSTTITAPAKPAIFEQTETFLATVPQRKAEIERLRIRERTADHELFVAKRTLLQAQAAVNLAGPDDPQIEEIRHFEDQATEAQATAHVNLQRARLKLMEAETQIYKDDGRAILASLQTAVIEHQRAAIEKFIRDEFEPAARSFQQVLQHGHALGSAVLLRGQTLSLITDQPHIKALASALFNLPDASTWGANAQAQAIFEANKVPSLALANLERHNAECKQWAEARYKQPATKGGFDSAGVFIVLQSGGARFNGVDYPRGSYVTLATIDPAGGKDAINKLKQLVSNGQIQMVSGEVQQQASA